MKRFVVVILMAAAVLPAKPARRVSARGGTCQLQGRRYYAGEFARRPKNNELVKCLPNGRWVKEPRP